MPAPLPLDASATGITITDVHWASHLRQQSMHVFLGLKNASRREVNVAPAVDIIDSQTKSVAAGKSKRLRLPAGATAVVEISLPAKNLLAWDPATPHSYRLRVRPGKSPREDLFFPCGYREIKTVSNSILLNGHPVNLRMHVLPAIEGADVFNTLRQIQSQDINCLLLQCADPEAGEPWLEAADQLGLMVVAEALFAWQGKKQWNRAEIDKELAGLAAWMGRHGTHPSLIAWNVGMFPPDLEEPKKLCAIYRQTARMDQSRPMMVSYPTPQDSCLAIHMLSGNAPVKVNDKPVMVELIPPFPAPWALAEIYDNQAFDWDWWTTGQPLWQLFQKQIQAWRVAGAAGFLPRYSMPGGWRQMFAPDLLIPKQEVYAAISNTQLSVSGDICLNDERKQAIELITTLTGPNIQTVSATWSSPKKIPQHMPFQVSFEIPQLNTPQWGEINLTLIEKIGGSQSGQDAQRVLATQVVPVHLWPAQITRWPDKVAQYDPSLSLENTIGLVATSDALNKASTIEQATLSTWLKNGGQLLIVQTQGKVPLMLGNWRWQSIAKPLRGWVRAPGHPVLQNLDSKDFQGWLVGQGVATGILAAPTSSSQVTSRVLVDAGMGIPDHHGLLVEMPFGRGRIFTTTLDLVAAHQHPAVMQLTNNLLREIGQSPPVPERHIQLFPGISRGLEPVLKACQVIPHPGQLPANQTLWLIDARQNLTNPELIKQRVREGALAFIFLATPEISLPWLRLANPQLSMEPTQVPEGLLLTASGPQTWGLCNADLCWSTGTWTERQNQTIPVPGVCNWQLGDAWPQETIMLTRPRCLAVCQDGLGQWVFSTMDWATWYSAMPETTTRVLGQLLFNLGMAPPQP